MLKRGRFLGFWLGCFFTLVSALAHVLDRFSGSVFSWFWFTITTLVLRFVLHCLFSNSYFLPAFCLVFTFFCVAYEKLFRLLTDVYFFG